MAAAEARDSNTNGSYDAMTQPSGRKAHTIWGYPMKVLKLCYEVEQIALSNMAQTAYAYLPSKLTNLTECFVDKLKDGSYRMNCPISVSQRNSASAEGTTGNNSAEHLQHSSIHNCSHFFWIDVYLKHKAQGIVGGATSPDGGSDRRSQGSGGGGGSGNEQGGGPGQTGYQYNYSSSAVYVGGSGENGPRTGLPNLEETMRGMCSIQ